MWDAEVLVAIGPRCELTSPEGFEWLTWQVYCSVHGVEDGHSCIISVSSFKHARTPERDEMDGWTPSDCHARDSPLAAFLQKPRVLACYATACIAGTHGLNCTLGMPHTIKIVQASSSKEVEDVAFSMEFRCGLEKCSVAWVDGAQVVEDDSEPHSLRHIAIRQPVVDESDWKAKDINGSQAHAGSNEVFKRLRHLDSHAARPHCAEDLSRPWRRRDARPALRLHAIECIFHTCSDCPQEDIADHVKQDLLREIEVRIAEVSRKDSQSAIDG
jgi:hypothetical protein